VMVLRSGIVQNLRGGLPCLTRAGARDVERRTVQLPVGEWGGRIGSLMATDGRALFMRLAPVFEVRHLGTRVPRAGHGDAGVGRAPHNLQRGHRPGPEGGLTGGDGPRGGATACRRVEDAPRQSICSGGVGERLHPSRKRGKSSGRSRKPLGSRKTIRPQPRSCRGVEAGEEALARRRTLPMVTRFVKTRARSSRNLPQLG
jgi:hypothetical protein